MNINTVLRFARSFFPLMSVLIFAACNNQNNDENNTGTNTADQLSINTSATKFAATKGCKNVGILLPESDSSARYEAYDRPLLEKEIKQAIPGVMIQYANANNNADTQQNQAEAA
ncbi:MAG: sugar ABC transporter substrate-binding protein, partial [Microcoleus sp. T3-bin5]|nr:sugar ABC transporter substrate-binding protein [Microcoleus sp. T3-bin5]